MNEKKELLSFLGEETCEKGNCVRQKIDEISRVKEGVEKRI